AGNGTDAFVAQFTGPLSAPVITSITTDSGASPDDFLTTDQTLSISGTADANVTVTVARAGVGVLGTTTANSSGAWTYDYTGTTLAEGRYSFTAWASLSVEASPLSPERTVTVDRTAPAVSLTPPPTTYDTTPWVTVTASD